MLGAWAGHARAQLDAGAAGAPRTAGVNQPATATDVRMREVPLAIVMVALTTLTLWSLGQAIVVQTKAIIGTGIGLG
jgi:hypothetical protein